MIKSWISGIMLCTLASALLASAFGGNIKKTIVSAGSVLTIIALLSPLRSVSGEDINRAFEAYSSAAFSSVDCVIAYDMASELLCEYIEEKTASAGYPCTVISTTDGSGNIRIEANADISVNDFPELSELISDISGIPESDIYINNESGDADQNEPY